MMKLPIYILLLIVGTQSCESVVRYKTEGIEEINTNQVIIFQDNKEHYLTEVQQDLTIDRENFSIQFYNKKYNSVTKEYYTAQITALVEKTAFQNISVGMKTLGTTCFGGGTAMAAAKEGYKSLVIGDFRHHYLFYEDEENKRLHLIEQKGDIFKFEFAINSIKHNKERVLLKDTKIKELYLAILIDRNLNKRIDKGELTKLTLKMN